MNEIDKIQNEIVFMLNNLKFQMDYLHSTETRYGINPKYKIYATSKNCKKQELLETESLPLVQLSTKSSKKKTERKKPQ